MCARSNITKSIKDKIQTRYGLNYRFKHQSNEVIFELQNRGKYLQNNIEFEINIDAN